MTRIKTPGLLRVSLPRKIDFDMSRIAVSGALTANEVARLQPGLQQALQSGLAQGAVEIDLGEVSDFDGAGLQLLLGFWHAATESGCDVILVDTPIVVATVLDEYDVADRFKTTRRAAIPDWR